MKGLLLAKYYRLNMNKVTRWMQWIMWAFWIMFSAILNAPNVFKMGRMLLWISFVIGNDESMWDRYRLTLPYSREDIVTAQYIFSCIIGVGIGVIGTLGHSLGQWARGVYQFREELLLLYCSLIWMCTIYGIGIYVICAKKSKTVLAVNVFFMAFITWSRFPEKIMMSIEKTATNVYIVLLLCCIIAAGCLYMSRCAAVSAYKKREI